MPIVTIISDQYKRDITQGHNEFDLDYNDLVEIVRNPTVSDTKNDTPYMFNYNMVYDNNGNSYTSQDNADQYTMLVFDVDDNCKILEFIKMMEEYQFVLFTTFSHTEEHHKFRAYFQIKHPIPLTTIKEKWFKKWFMKKFPMQDPSILKFVGTYLPNTPDISTYQYHCNRGRLFDFDDYKDEMEVLRKRIEKLDKIKKARRDSKTAEFKNRRPKVPDVSNNPKVTDYTHTPVSSTGYGALSFRALAVCVASGDDKTLEEVIDKMRLDSFSEQEITRAINNCRKR